MPGSMSSSCFRRCCSCCRPRQHHAATRVRLALSAGVGACQRAATARGFDAPAQEHTGHVHASRNALAQETQEEHVRAYRKGGRFAVQVLYQGCQPRAGRETFSEYGQILVDPRASKIGGQTSEGERPSCTPSTWTSSKRQAQRNTRCSIAVHRLWVVYGEWFCGSVTCGSVTCLTPC